jgi:HK97 family phage prohead protease
VSLHKLNNVVFVRTAVPVAVKFASGQPGVIEGYASLFDGEADSQGDIIAPGAFAKSLVAHDRDASAPVMLWSHDPTRPIGRWESVQETRKGLKVAGRLNLETADGREAYEHIKAGDVNGLSIGYRVQPGGGYFDAQTGAFTLTDIDLLEVSVVAVPAKRGARITGVKHLGSQRELEQLLHDAGLAHGAAAKLAAGGWPALAPRQIETPEIEDLADRVKTGFGDLLNVLKGVNS